MVGLLQFVEVQLTRGEGGPEGGEASVVYGAKGWSPKKKKERQDPTRTRGPGEF